MAALVIQCDWPDCKEELTIQTKFAPQARREAKAKGWAVAEPNANYMGPDFCPEHAK